MPEPTQVTVWSDWPALNASHLLIERTYLFGKVARSGVWRPRPKLIVSEIASDAAAMGAAITPLRSAFY